MKNKLLVVLTVINILCLAHFNVLANRLRVTAVAVGAQSGTVTYGTAGSVTYTITLTTSTVTGTQANDALLLSWTTTPTGVTTTLTPNAGTYNTGTGAYSPASTTSFTLTIAYTATTPAGSFAFSINNTENNGGTSSSTGGTFLVYPKTPTVSGAGTGCSITLTASGGLPAGGTYNWYNVSTGGTALATGTTYFPVATGTYYASYTSNSVEGARSTGAAVTLTAGPALSSAPAGPAGSFYLSYPFTGNANDASGNSDNGTVQGGATLTTDRYNTANSAYSFNGSTQYISTATGEPAPGPTNFSLSVWFKTSTAGGLLVGYSASQTGSGSQYDRMIYMSNTGTLYFGIYSGAAETINTTTTYADGFWHHAVATCSSTSGSNLYVDGALQATSTTMTAPEVYTGVGYWRVAFNNLSGWVNPPTDDYFTGSLDDIAVYNSAITASQVYTLYGAGSVPACAGDALSLQANTISGATYAWTGPLSFSSSSQNPTVSTAATTAMAGTYTCIVTSSGGCSTQIKVTAVVNSTTLPTATFTATSPVYVNNNSTITYTGTYSATSTYTWNFAGGTVASGSGVGPYTVNWATAGSKTVTLTVTNSSGCYSSSTQTVVVNSTNFGSYAFSMPLTLKSSSLGISTDLSNFPYLVTITDPSLVYTTGGCSNKVQFPNGPSYDFAFVDAASNTECPYQVESYDQVNGILLVWVKIPTLSHTTNNTIYFNYGLPTAPSTHNTAFYESTWTSDYLAVYHFNETTYTGSMTDGTSNGHTGSGIGMTAANLVTGKVGNAYSFDGTKSITTNSVNISGTFTISAWINLSATGHDQKIMTNQAASGSSTGGYKMGVYSDNTIEAESGTSINRSSTPTPTAFGTGAWHYVQAVFNGTSLSNYVDGAQYKVLSTTNAPTSNNPFYVGVGEGGSQYYFYGTIDEVRVSNVAKTGDWLLAEYTNQSAPASYVTQGAITTSFTNASALYGGITYSTADGINYTYTINSTTTAGTPPNDGTANFVITGTGVTDPATATIYGLTVNASDKLNLNGQTINVGCNIVNNGTISNSSATASSIVFDGTSSTQSYTGTSTSTGTLDNLTVNNSAAGTVTITGGAVTLNKALTLTDGNLVIDNTNSGALALASTATQTAYVAAIPTGSSITGTVAVQRYITGGSGYRTYRLISSPVYNGTVTPNNVYSLNYLQNNIYLTGSAGGGFDKTGNPTLYLFREDQTPSNVTFTSGNFWGISAINNSPTYNYYLNNGTTAYNLPVGNGMLVFFRGNRASATVTSETMSTYVPVAATLSTSGTLNQGTVVVHSWYVPGGTGFLNYSGTGTTGNYPVRGFNLVGNPYASSIDWSTFSNTTSTAAIYGLNVTPTIWTFDPKTKNYASYNALTNIATGNGGKIIASGQGFFVLATALSPSLTFQEAAKSTSQLTSGSTLLMSTQPTRASLTQSAYGTYMRLKMVTDTVNYNDMVIGFNSTSSTKFNIAEDSKFIDGMGNSQSLAAISSDSIKASVKWVPFPKNSANQVIKLNVGAAASGQFTMERTDLKEIPAIYEVWLMDGYKKDSLDIRNNTNYIFDVDLTDTTSYGANRFTVVVRQNPALGVHLLDFTALKENAGSQVVWKTENEYDYTNFTVERSTDGGATYSVIDGVASSSQGTYSFLDKTPVKGADMYRLQITDLNGNITYSNIVTIMYGNTSATLVKTGIVVYPNPATTTLNLSIATGFDSNGKAVTGSSLNATQTYNIEVANIAGSVMKQATISQQTWQMDVSSLMPGTYVIRVTNKSTNTVVGESSFIVL